MTRPPLRVAFAGTPPFASEALERIVQAGFTVPLVLTQLDRPAGRGMKLLASAVKAAALTHGLPLVQPRSLRLDGRFPADARAAQQALHEARPDVLVVAAYGLILPPWVLELPRLGGLNIHASLLPRWRGAAPVQRAIAAGDAETGITLMQMDAGLDTGDILAMTRLAIEPGENAGSLAARLAQLGAAMVVDLLATLAGGGAVERRAQPAEGATYAHKVDKAEAAIDWRDGAVAIERRVRAFDPAPGANFVLEGETVKLWRAALADGHAASPGEVLVASGGRLCVACGEGALDLLELQRPGHRRQPVGQFLQTMGDALTPGLRLALPAVAAKR